MSLSMIKCIGLVCLLFTSLVFGNGGGYDYGVEFTGGVAPFSSEGTEHIEILDEQLDIYLGLEEAKVKVVYKMKNTSTKTQKVKFGFPIEEVVDEWGIKSKSAELYCKNYEAKLNGTPLKFEYFKEPFAEGKVKEFKGSEVLKGIEGWNVSRMKLKAGEEIVLSISYDSVYDYTELFISDDSTSGPWLFRYRFSSGAVWKNSIKSGRVRIHMNDLNVSDIKVLHPVNRYKVKGNVISWDFEELEPTLKDDLVLQVRSAISFYSTNDPDKRINGYYFIKDKWFSNHMAYKVSASSTLAAQGENKYVAENVKNMWSEVWSEGVKGSGIGESLEFTFEKPMKLSQIALSAGYFGDGDKAHLYKANNRVKSAELLINGKVHQVIRLDDIQEVQLIDINYTEPVKMVKFIIKDVYKGSKYDDTCISTVSFLSPLSKEPKRYGAR